MVAQNDLCCLTKKEFFFCSWWEDLHLFHILIIDTMLMSKATRSVQMGGVPLKNLLGQEC